MPEKQAPPRFAIFRDAQLVVRAAGDAVTAKARLEQYAHLAPDHQWWYVVYDDERALADAERTGMRSTTGRPRQIH